MKANEFCYWLQGMFELNHPTTLNEEQVKIIENHLKMVFIHEIDKSYPTEQIPALEKAHKGNGFQGKDNTGELLRC